MRTPKASLALSLLALLGPSQDPQTPLDPLVAAVIEAHNSERAKEKLPPLKFAPLLEAAARGHAIDMADRDLMTHEGADGTTPAQRIVRAGYHYQTSGENVAKYYDDVPKVMQGWLDSPPHKKNILGDFTEIGVARALSKDGKPYWCVDFGKPIPKFEPTDAAADLLRKLNDERTTAKLPTVAMDDRLARVAREQADMIARAKTPVEAKLSFDGIDTSKYRELALTTAVGQPDADTALKSLLGSDEHKEKLLGKFTRAGIGYATAESGRPAWVIILGSPADR